MNPTAIYSKSGKGVQEASGKSSLLARPDRAVLSAIDGRATLADVAQKVGKTFDNTFRDLITKLDKDGFIREVSPGTAAPAGKGAPAKPAAKAEPSGGGGGGDLDFSSLGTPSTSKPAPPPQRPAAPPSRPTPPPPPPKPAAPPRPDPAAEAAAKAQQSALQKAREEAEAKADAERQRVKAEAEAKMRSEMESKARADAEKKMKEEAERKAKEEADAKIKAARDAAARAAAEAKAKAEAEAKAKIEAERKAREEMERRLEQERKAREEAERKAKEEAERARKQLEEERRKLEEERKREEQERAARRKREEQEEAERRKRAEQEEAERRRKREEEDRRHEEERTARRKQRDEEEEAARSARPARQEAPEPAPQKAPAAGGLDSLMADLDSFTTREEEDRKQHEEAERKEKEEAARRQREEMERRDKEEAERRAKEEARERKAEEKRKKKEEEEDLGRKREKEEQRLKEEEEKRKREADDRERKAKQDEVLAARATRQSVVVGEDSDQVRKRMMGKRGAAAPAAMAQAPARRKKGLGVPLGAGLFLVIAAVVGVAHFMPLSTADYERAASEAVGKPVKIGEINLSLFTGLQLKAKNVRIGDDVSIPLVTAVPEFSTLSAPKKLFSRIEFENVKLPQDRLGDALFARVMADNFYVQRIVVRKLELTGAVPLPQPLEAELNYGIEGTLTSATLRGPDTLVARLTPGKGGAVEFDVTASGFPLPMVPDVTLSGFAMKGTATPRGITISDWGGKIYGGGVSGTANVRWGNNWSLEGVVTARNINAAVFAPALLSEGKGEGTGRFSMAGADPAKLGSGGRLEGSFTINGGVLGSFDLAKAIRSSGKEATGRTQFNELSGQAVYDRGSIALRNVSIGAGALNAGASADIAPSGALSGRIVADVKTAGRSQSATLNLGGTVKEPQVRN